ncbi:hypothetical protein B0H19DRAFT_1026950 [Mycena capillaripes]|nr:hypothetical protein B0H19DRAFT_1026950 [Mycena capillaripes]
MRPTSTAFLLASLTVLANAHFQLQFPAPRGVFVEDDEPNFCDGYDNPAANRTAFPLTGGFYSLNSEHTAWTAGVALSTLANPTKFSDFLSVVPFFTDSGEGIFCFNLDFSKTNATGLKDGQNVTLEIIFDGGDGQLFQCADLTLSSTVTLDKSSLCKNVSSSGGDDDDDSSSASGSSTGSGSSPSSTAPAPSGSSTGTPPSGATNVKANGLVAFGLGLLGVVAAVL